MALQLFPPKRFLPMATLRKAVGQTLFSSLRSFTTRVTGGKGVFSKFSLAGGALREGQSRRWPHKTKRCSDCCGSQKQRRAASLIVGPLESLPPPVSQENPPLPSVSSRLTFYVDHYILYAVFNPVLFTGRQRKTPYSTILCFYKHAPLL